MVMVPEKNAENKKPKTLVFKWNLILLTAIILLLAVNIFCALRIKSLRDAQITRMEEVTLPGLITQRNIRRWGAANSVLQIIYEHRKDADATIDDLKDTLRQLAEDPEYADMVLWYEHSDLSFYDLAAADLTSTEYPNSASLHIWSNALCAPGITAAASEIEENENYRRNILQPSKAQDFAIVYGGETLSIETASIKCLDTQSGFDSSLPTLETLPTAQKGEEND